MEPTIADYVLAALLCGMSLALIFRKVTEAHTANRLSFYFSAALSSLVLSAALIGFWWINGRPLDSFGLYSWLGDVSVIAAFAAGWIAVLGVAVQLIKQGVLRSPLTKVYRKYEQLMPTNRPELAASWVTSMFAGTGEEIVYRGFLMWVAVDLTGLAAGLVLTSLLFGAAHGYQSRLGMVFATVAGLILGGVYIASGSLFLVMLMHATYNIASFRAGMILLRQESRREAALAG